MVNKRPNLARLAALRVPTPPPKPMKVHDSGVDESILRDLSRAFDYLYDPFNMDHLPMSSQLDMYRKRDLFGTKFYKTALRYFGTQRAVMELLGHSKGRKRVLVAPPMSSMKVTKDVESYCSPLKPASCQKNVSKETSAPLDALDPTSDYKTRLQQRQAFRSALDNLGDMEKWLSGKPDKTEMERRAAKRIYDEKHPVEVVPEKVEKPLEGRDTGIRPKILRPSPQALMLIDSELRRKKLRLVDLFTDMDKDKSWTITHAEFKKAFLQAELRVPDYVVEDLINTLDFNNMNQLDYRELAIGLEEFRVERRSQKSATSRDSEQMSRESTFSTKADPLFVRDFSSDEYKARRISREPSPSLDIPDQDVAIEKYVFKDKETALDIRKRDRYALKNWEHERIEAKKRRPCQRTSSTPSSDKHRDNIFRTGYAPYDQHNTPSVLEGEVSQRTDQFRQTSFQEYMAIVRLCEERGVCLNEKLMEKVLLHPADKTPSEIGDTIRQPGTPLELSRKEVVSGIETLSQPWSSVRTGPGSRRSTLASRRSPSSRRSTLASNVGFTAYPGGGTGVDTLPAIVNQDDDMLSAATAGFAAGLRPGEEAVVRPRRGVNLAQVGRGLPTKEDLTVEEDDLRVHLSTGWATIRRKVDCWLPFEEFESLTKHLSGRDHSSIRPVRSNSFWPGQLLHNFRMVLDKPPHGARGMHTVFNRVPPCYH